MNLNETQMKADFQDREWKKENFGLVRMIHIFLRVSAQIRVSVI